MKYIGIGDNVVDRYVNEKVMFPGGNPVNFAAFIAELGKDSSYMGVLTDDAEGVLIRESLESLGVDLSHCLLKKGLGTERCDVEIRNGDRVFIGSCHGGMEHENLELGDEQLKALNDYDVIHCGCYAEMDNEMIKLKGIGAIKPFDFSTEDEYRDPEYLAKVCPYIDIALFSDSNSDAVDAHENIADLKSTCLKLGTEMVLVTRGHRGQILFTKENKYEGTIKVIETLDTMGAGDAFFASFLVKLIDSGWSKGQAPADNAVKEALDFAADFSAKNCQREGAFGFGTNY